MANLVAPQISLNKDTLILSGIGGGVNTSYTTDDGMRIDRYSYGYEVYSKRLSDGYLTLIDRIYTDVTSFTYVLNAYLSTHDVESIVSKQFEEDIWNESPEIGGINYSYSVESNAIRMPVNVSGSIKLSINPSSALITQPNYSSDIKLTINANGLVTSIPAPLDGLSTLTLPVKGDIECFNSRYMVEYSGNISLNIKGSNTVETYVNQPPTLPDISYNFITDELTINSVNHTKLKIYKASNDDVITGLNAPVIDATLTGGNVSVKMTTASTELYTPPSYELVKEVITSNATYVEHDLSDLLGNGNWRVIVRAENAVGRITNDSNVIECGFTLITQPNSLNVVRAVEVRDGFVSLSFTPSSNVVSPIDFISDISLQIKQIGSSDIGISLPLFGIVELVGIRAITAQLVGNKQNVNMSGSINITVYLDAKDFSAANIEGKTPTVILDSLYAITKDLSGKL